MNTNIKSLTLVLLLCAAHILAESSTDETSNVIHVVSTYCKLDGMGALLQSGTRDFSKIMSLEDNPPENGWDAVEVIHTYNITSATVTEKSATVVVRFEVLGYLYGDGSSLYEPKVEDVVLRLVRHGSSWKIIRSDSLPHVLVDNLKTKFPELREWKSQ